MNSSPSIIAKAFVFLGAEHGKERVPLAEEILHLGWVQPWAGIFPLPTAATLSATLGTSWHILEYPAWITLRSGPICRERTLAPSQGMDKGSREFPRSSHTVTTHSPQPQLPGYIFLNSPPQDWGSAAPDPGPCKLHKCSVCAYVCVGGEHPGQRDPPG